jgi:hypothetical protein
MPKSSRFGKLLFATAFLILTALFSWEVFAADMSIVEVRRNIPLSDEAPVYKDFYLNAGSESGLKKNMVLTIMRKTIIRDASGAQSFGEMEVPVGQLKVIAIQNKIAIAREYKLISRDEEPMLEQIGMMIGDVITMDGSFIDNKKASAR